ncbi:type II toxin-antitoxin system HipA family toxin [Gilvimarinus agarilyticus]|uniref:type II toxin-antitoxin system HipA family toxin n=1 Tax=Gilvimarinus sp. 2_MG-2023 TaxID=3062666 RepID=UPI001C0A0E79|nr:type II toxin-antitoxin system HipA family toxin [Gilvimarinus sp. 2_MG-2023]MBU2886405.1 type II toxin-antitoxin system HipA family toxin [Gilvimarinus agarilyticus]MDO6571086.1 type II toxin-antitoxin system HipA family toxin [Gilvimarinus sp. 2_MG-2023]
MQRRPYSRCYVFAVDPSGKVALAGELEMMRTGGSFKYSASWLARADRYALDPENLPLVPEKQYCDNTNGVFPVFSDAGPDDWGNRVMLQRHESQPRNEIERLLRTSGTGVGALRFSLSRTRPKPPPPAQDIALLERLAIATESIEKADELSPDEFKLIEHGSSMGGARPKAVVADGDNEYIVKFSKQGDLLQDLPRVEFATMTLLAKAGLNVPEVRIQNIGADRTAYLIRRFDVEAGRVVRHYLSAHALFNKERHKKYADGHHDDRGYIALSRKIRSHCQNPTQDCVELFDRIVANVLLGNSDDHPRNHGFVYDLNHGHWGLAPLFDVVPILSAMAKPQAMTIGTDGYEPSVANILSCAQAFGLSQHDALKRIGGLVEILATWEKHYQSCGVSAADIRQLKRLIGTRIKEARQALGQI